MRKQLPSYRLREPSSRPKEDDDKSQRRKAYTHDVTNDSKDGQDAHILIKDGYPYQFSCLEFVDPKVTRHKLPLEFDYEVTMSAKGESTFDDNLRALEWSILWNVVRRLGLHKCDFKAQDLLFGQARVQQEARIGGVPQHRQLKTPPLVVSLNSDEADKEDGRVEKCSVPQQPNPDATGPDFCFPMNGFMSVEYVGDKPEKVRQLLLDMVADAMSSSRILVEDVVQVTYIGTRTVPAAADVLSSPEGSTGGLQISVFGIGLLVSLLAFVMSLILGFYVSHKVKRRRRRRTSFKNEMPYEITVPEGENSSLSGETSASPTEALQVAAMQGDTIHPSASLEPDGLMVESGSVSKSGSGSGSVYLPSKRKRKLKKRKKKKKALRQKVSMGPSSGIDTIHEENSGEVAEEDLDGESYSSYSTDDDSEDQKGDFSFRAFDFLASLSRTWSPPSSPSQQKETKQEEEDEDAMATIPHLLATNSYDADENPPIGSLPPPW
eukprot:CAMPEP_0116845308 /NCGR_PEP_ID=MMETSP0418-20121206/13188_1 /TAXON_ID=1158023 /ORGANISM="Astrosyne radiata, Strain 13vi08-1A" /LENGTH=492 /DNA_ID=CAMNT_0004476391 /DNA_START=163 /DNA_END=1638 /DNA_ORIENTATION=+